MPARRIKVEAREDGRYVVRLILPHEHAERQYKPGDLITVDGVEREFLENQGVIERPATNHD